jgi:hypothetical protein
MTVAEFIEDIIRPRMDEIDPQGGFSDTDLLYITNNILRNKVIPDLWSIGEEFYLASLMISGDLSLSESSLDDSWKEGTITEVTGFDAFYRPSIKGFVAGTYDTLMVIFVPFSIGYSHLYYTGSPKEEVTACLRGNTLIVFDDDYDTITVHGIKTPDYIADDTIELDNYLIDGLLSNGVCAECWIRDKGLTMRNIHRDEYASVFGRLSRDVGGVRALMERTPPDYFGNFYKLQDGVGSGVGETW